MHSFLLSSLIIFRERKLSYSIRRINFQALYVASSSGIMLPKDLKLYNRKHTRKHLPTVIEDLCHQFSLEDLKKSTNNFHEGLDIGFHVGGRIYKGFLKFNGVADYAIALKRFNLKSDRAFNVDFKNEIEVLCQLNHPNVVSLIGFCDHKDEKIIVYKYGESNMSLEKCLISDLEPLSWKKRLEICIGTACGLHYLHSGTKRTIFHRDIKPRNILLDNNMVPKLSGFGLHLKGPKLMSKPKPIQVAGTIGYLAPEHVMDGTFTDKSDVYSFGHVLRFVVCAMDHQTFFTVLRSPIEENIDPILKGKVAPECWNVFLDIMKRCLNFDPNERPMIGEVEVQLEHALSLQEEADIRNANANCYYTLLTTTTIIQYGRPEDYRSESESDQEGMDSLH